MKRGDRASTVEERVANGREREHRDESSPNAKPRRNAHREEEPLLEKLLFFSFEILAFIL